MRKIFKKCMACIVASVLLLFSFSGCADRADSFTIEEHIQRIGERMRARDLTKKPPYGFTYDNFEVYPLYNENDEVRYFLIEFEPCGFILIYLREQASIINSRTLYQLIGFYDEEEPWSPYVIDETKKETNEYKKWILDENGERIYYSKSPYYVANCINKKKYAFPTLDGLVPAIKKDGEFVNLISGEIINRVPEMEDYGQAVLGAAMYAKSGWNF